MSDLLQPSPAAPVTVHTSDTETPARRARPPRVLIVLAGKEHDTVTTTLGGYAEWFAQALNPLGVDHDQVRVYAGEALPYGGRYDGIIISGSPLSVRDQAPWMPVVGQWALAMAAHTPVLAVCFGLQLIGEALGGYVQANPRGPEWGTSQVELTPAGRADPLFDGLPDTLLVQEAHGDVVLREPQAHRFTRLAGNTSSPLQALAVGPWLRAVQFHPELTAQMLDTLIKSQGWSPTQAVLASDHGPHILKNWVTYFVLRADPRPYA